MDSKTTPIPGGDNSVSGGDLDQQKQKDTVSYETHQRLLAEKKKLQAQMEEVLSKEKQRTEAELQKQNEWQKLADLKAKEAEDARREAENYKRVINDGRKLDAVLSALSGEVPKHYMGLLDLEKIVVDPSTGEPDPSSVREYVKVFESAYPEIIRRTNGPKLPNHAPQGGSATLTYDEWKALPLKEQKARMGELMASDKKL